MMQQPQPPNNTARNVIVGALGCGCLTLVLAVVAGIVVGFMSPAAHRGHRGASAVATASAIRYPRDAEQNRPVDPAITAAMVSADPVRYQYQRVRFTCTVWENVKSTFVNATCRSNPDENALQFAILGDEEWLTRGTHVTVDGYVTTFVGRNSAGNAITLPAIKPHEIDRL